MAATLGADLGKVTVLPFCRPCREPDVVMTDLPDSESLFTKLNRETARIHWHELQRFYAQGAVLEVSPGLDLIAVATAMAEDDAAQIKAYLTRGDLSRVEQVRAEEWLASDPQLWAVVVAPWVLVQTARELN